MPEKATERILQGEVVETGSDDSSVAKGYNFWRDQVFGFNNDVIGQGGQEVLAPRRISSIVEVGEKANVAVPGETVTDASFGENLSGFASNIRGLRERKRQELRRHSLPKAA